MWIWFVIGHHGTQWQGKTSNQTKAFLRPLWPRLPESDRRKQQPNNTIAQYIKCIVPIQNNKDVPSWLFLSFGVPVPLVSNPMVSFSPFETRIIAIGNIINYYHLQYCTLPSCSVVASSSIVCSEEKKNNAVRSYLFGKGGMLQIFKRPLLC